MQLGAVLDGWELGREQRALLIAEAGLRELEELKESIGRASLVLSGPRESGLVLAAARWTTPSS